MEKNVSAACHMSQQLKRKKKRFTCNPFSQILLIPKYLRRIVLILKLVSINCCVTLAFGDGFTMMKNYFTCCIVCFNFV